MWTTWGQFQEKYPRVAAELSETDFDELATRAARVINYQTHHRAALASTDAERGQLAECQSELIVYLYGVDREDAQRGSAGDGVTSYTNDGYSESFAPAADVDETRARRKRAIVRESLSAPDTAWMIYAGGVYFHPGRR